MRLPDFLKKLKVLRTILPAGVAAILAFVTLTGYEAPVYEVQARPLPEKTEPAEEEETAELVLPELVELSEEDKTEAEGIGTLAKLAVVDDSNAQYKDGTYTGTAAGFGGSITVEVTITDGRIASIRVVSASGETPSYFARAKAVLTAMVNRQSTNVDTVSGATYSSNGLIMAVRSALKKAVADGTESEEEEPEEPEKKKKPARSKDKYVDGKYIASAEGYGGPIKVCVIIKKGKIAKIKVLSAEKETPEFFDRAVVLLDDIIAYQSTDVDVVTGATYSSNGLIKAVKKALKLAKKGKTGKPDDPEEEEQDDGGVDGGDDEEQEKPEQTDVNEGEYRDGTYTGTGAGFGGTLTLSVTLSGGKITDITILSHNDTEEYFEMAKALLPAIIEAQSTGVDVVSGATYSSNGILEAVNDCLDQAKKAAGGDDTGSESGEDGTGDGGSDTGEGGNTGDSGEDTGETGSDTGEDGDDSGNDTGDSGDDTGDGGDTGDEGDDTGDGGDDTGDDTGEGQPSYKESIYDLIETVYCDEYEDFADYDLSMTITIRDGLIWSITNVIQESVNYSKANEMFISKALNGIQSAAVGQNSTAGIDVVSGATCSSYAILDGLDEALKKWKAENS